MRFLMWLFCAVVLAAGAAVAQQAGSGWLGADIKDLTKEEAEALGWEEPRGAKVVKPVPGSPAEAAGLQPDDVLRVARRAGDRQCREFRQGAEREAGGGGGQAVGQARGQGKTAWA